MTRRTHMIHAQQFLQNLPLLYDTLDDPVSWERSLKDTCDLLRSEGGNVVVASRG